MFDTPFTRKYIRNSYSSVIHSVVPSLLVVQAVLCTFAYWSWLPVYSLIIVLLSFFYKIPIEVFTASLFLRCGFHFHFNRNNLFLTILRSERPTQNTKRKYDTGLFPVSGKFQMKSDNARCFNYIYAYTFLLYLPRL